MNEKVWPQRIMMNGIKCEAHADWCPIGKLVSSFPSNWGFVDIDGAGLKCRCHLRPVSTETAPT